MKRVFSIVICLLVAIIIGCMAESASDSADKILRYKDGSLSIPVSKFTDGVLMINLKSGETDMQLLAHLGSDGTPKLSWNTCQVCNGSPFAFFEYINDQLVCKNCGNAFPVDSIGGNNTGCYPWALSDYTVGETAVTVSAQEIDEMVPNFKNWKKGL